jgi:hypothetical protein
VIVGQILVVKSGEAVRATGRTAMRDRHPPGEGGEESEFWKKGNR